MAIDSITGDAVIARYRRHYPELTFAVDRGSLRVTTQATIAADGTRGVVVHDGFLLHPAVGVEALAVALAHEVAHHVWRRDAGGLGDEQWADYQGVSQVMPRVWGTSFAAVATAGLVQLARLWRLDCAGAAGADPIGYDYPAPAVRVATIAAAIAGRPHPATR